MTREIPGPICLGCQHFQDYHEGTGICAAFPDGIPDAIWDSQADHRQPFDDDQGIQFAPTSPQKAEYADLIFAHAPTATVE